MSLRLIASIALGLGSLASVLAAFLLQQNQDIRPILMVAFGGFFVAAMLSPKDDTPGSWRTGTAVALGGIIPALLLSYFDLAFTDQLYLLLYCVTAAITVAAALIARWFKSQRRIGGAVAIAAFAVAAAGFSAFRVVPSLEDERAYQTVDRAIAPFSVRTLEGKEISSDSWRGRVVVLSYWATWCPPCLAEMPKIAALVDAYRDDPKVAIISLNAGYGGDTPGKARSFLQRHNLPLSSEIDDIRTNGAAKGMAAGSLGLKVLPTLFILDESGRLVAIHVGFDNSENLPATLRRHIDLIRVKDSPARHEHLG
ncbi:MAG TPA: TlpA disulfide reductase family protein [Pirellulales bacterium]